MQAQTSSKKYTIFSKRVSLKTNAYPIACYNSKMTIKNERYPVDIHGLFEDPDNKRTRDRYETIQEDWLRAVLQVLGAGRPESAFAQVAQSKFLDEVKRTGGQDSHKFLSFVDDGKIKFVVPQLEYGEELELISTYMEVEMEGSSTHVVLLQPQFWPFLEMKKARMGQHFKMIRESCQNTIKDAIRGVTTFNAESN